MNRLETNMAKLYLVNFHELPFKSHCHMADVPVIACSFGKLRGTRWLNHFVMSQWNTRWCHRFKWNHVRGSPVSVLYIEYRMSFFHNMKACFYADTLRIPEPTICLKKAFSISSYLLSLQQLVRFWKENFKHGRAIGSQDWRDSFTSKRKI